MEAAENALEIEGLTKAYKGFCLKQISFTVPKGTIVGFIGENGAGKSTTLNLILGLARSDGGVIQIAGQAVSDANSAIRETIGVVFDGNNFPGNDTPDTLRVFLRALYPAWDDAVYQKLLARLDLPAGKRIRQFSKGMRMKLALAAAFSHHARLLILDEPTSGLDPIVREEILDLLLEYVEDAENSVLISSHITSDLNRIADYIVFIHDGAIVFEKPKDELIYQYGILRCTTEQYGMLDPADMIASRKQAHEWEALVRDRKALAAKYPEVVIDAATLDEIMLLYVKGTRL